MALSLPSLETIHADLLASYRGRFPDDDLSTYSDTWHRLRTLAGGLLGTYHQISVAENDVFPDTATGTILDRHATIHGITRRAATPARKSDALRVYGTAASTVSIGDELTSDAGLTYQINENDTVPAAGYVDVDVVAVDVGAQTQIQAGETLTFTSAPAGIEDVAELQLDMDEDGEDAESDGELSKRILAKIASPGMGGNANDYQTWALEITGVATAYVYPLRRGRGSVDIAALHTGSGSVRLLDSDERDELFDYIDELRPVHLKGFRVLEVTTEEEAVEVTVEARPGSDYAWDWDDATPLVVAAWTAGTKTLQFTTSVPDDLKKGDRIVIMDAAAAGDGIPLEVEATDDDDATLGADEIRLTTAPSHAPASPDTVYAGGELTTPIRDAIVDLFDALGPAVGTYGTGEWDDELNPAKIGVAVIAVDGVRDFTVVTPATTQTPEDPSFPNDDDIELLIPGEIIVRKQ